MRRALRLGSATLAGLFALLVFGGSAFLRIRRGETSQVDEVIPGIVHARNFFCDVYAARVGSEAVLFEAGVDPEGRAVDRMLKKLGLGRSDVTHVFLSHAHFDHVAAAGLYPRAKVHIGSADLDMLAHREGAHPLTPRVLGALMGGVPLEANAPLLDRRALRVGGAEAVLVLPFPGHTPGSFLFLFRGILFTGDSINLQNGCLTPATPSHSVNPAGNRTSIRGIFRLLEGHVVERVCTGHMGCTASGTAPTLLHALVDSLR